MLKIKRFVLTLTGLKRKWYILTSERQLPKYLLMYFGQFINLFMIRLINPYYLSKIMLALCKIEECSLDDNNCG